MTANVAHNPPWAGGSAWGPWSAPVRVGEPISTAAIEQHPTISRDGLALYFASNRAGGVGGLDLWVSTRESTDAPWGMPANLGSAINSAANDLAAAFSPDGHTMYYHSFGRGGCGGADLFVSRRHDKREPLAWGAAENLGCVINSASNDAGPTVFEDESGVTTMIFTSTRPGGAGDFDMYQSIRGEDGSWGTATYVAELSGPARDTRTTIARDGLTLFMSSDVSGRAGGVGGQDLWMSTRASTSSPWSTPVNLGPTVNSSGFDGAPSLSFDGTTLYFYSDRGGNNDIYVTTRTRVR